jgi:hypothetical protein
MQTKIIGIINKTIAHPYFPIITLLLINLVAAVLVVTDYGESWDEKPRYQYAENSLNAYKGVRSDLEDEKGPFFVMVAAFGADLVCQLKDDCQVSDIRHTINFLSFLLGLFFLYRLNNRFVGRWAAFTGALLFNTQPLLWGHAFINPKDLPFMALFIASIDTGMAISNKFRASPIHKNSPENPQVTIRSRLISEWESLSKFKKYLLLITSCIVILLVAGFSLFQDPAHQLIENLIRDLYTDKAQGFLAVIFNRSAQNIHNVPVEDYVHKAWQIYLRTARNLSIFLVISWMITIFSIFSRTSRYLWNHHVKPILHQTWDELKRFEGKPFIKEIWSIFKDPRVITAGVFWGLASATRTLGPFAAGLVSFYLLLKHRKQALPTLIVYFIIGAITIYIAWPGLWDHPIKNYLDSLFMASDFPWDGKVLFRGIEYDPGTLPKTFLPVLLSIQFTVTAILTIVGGILISLTNMFKQKSDWIKLTVLYLWILIPFAFVITLEPKYYDNFRHFLFIIPPLFVFAAIGIQRVFDAVKRPAIQALIAILLILPNLFPLVRLHPYQYVYYNLFTGGLPGAFRSYEMDYWGTSFREATDFVNQTAPQDAKIYVYGPTHLVDKYAREDLKIRNLKRVMPTDRDSPAFAILLSRYNKDINLFPELESIFRVERDGAIFAVVKYLQTNTP